MRFAATHALVLTLALFAACREDEVQTTINEPAAASPAAITPEQLGELGAEIRKDPARGQDALARHGMTRETFEKAIRDVTENPEASRRYAEAYRKASA